MKNGSNRRALTRLALAALIGLAALAAPAPAPSSLAHGGPTGGDPGERGKKVKDGADCQGRCLEGLDDARAGTARYHREEFALADGFFSTVQCVAVPALGGMGVHYVNPQRLMDTQIVAGEPEVLLYEPQADGTNRLVGVEYIAPVLVTGPNGPQPYFGQTPPVAPLNAAPVLFGRAFDGPMPGHGPGEPWHYDLHVWVWRHNPAGMFAPFNPRVSCPAQGGHH
ncbi:MAG: hypothetical protein LC800_04425 [Acidobacteria bacterium]|nr:hypothetical protein [Acidobacteriota bacterium]